MLYPLKKRHYAQQGESFALGEALASGIFLGAAFFHMLPDSIKLFAQLYGTSFYPFPELIAITGFLLLLFLEQLTLRRHTSQAIPYLLVFILTIHAIVEGAALGISGTFAEIMMLFIAIAAHKGSESFALCINLLRHQIPFKQIAFISVFFACMTPLGISLGTIVNAFTFTQHGALLSAIFNAFAAGSFLYIAALHHMHFHHHKDDKRGLIEFGCLVLGVMIMGVLAGWA